MSLKVLVLGAGAVGGFFGGRLAQAGADVTFLVRPKRKAQLAEQGLQIESRFGNASLRVPANLQSEIAPGYDVVLLTCKAYDLSSAIDSIGPVMSDSTAVLPLLNGISHIEQLNGLFRARNVLPGAARIQVTLTPQGVVRQLNEWQTIIFGTQDGSTSPRLQALKTFFDAAGIDARISPDIMRELWWKLVHLATVAGMTCLMRANIGEIARTSEGSSLFTTFLEINAKIAAHAGFPPTDSFLQGYHDLFRQRDSMYEASMLRDLEKGGPIEADHILGFMLRRCREAGLPDLLHLTAYTHAKSYEERRAARRLPFSS
jgi:2-dehydropantoate 2-reductase